jgi:2-oxoglutarate ferredoxin oxidoreductase subunit beta
MATAELTLKSFESDVHPDWCPGCGDFGVLKSIKEAIVELHIAPHKVLIVSGIGCSSNLPGFIRAYGVHSLHGRALPVATGAALANHDLHVIAVGGDGDGYGIGMGHFIHAMRRNLNLTYIVMDNEIYGLTTNQASPTTTKNHKTKSTPRGNVERPMQPLTLALATGATYVARGSRASRSSSPSSPRRPSPTRVLPDRRVQPCVTFNMLNSYPWFKERVYKLEEDAGYDPTDLMAALPKSLEFGERIPIGLLYRSEKPTYEDTEPVLRKRPLVEQPLNLDRATLDSLLAETM